MFQSEAKHYILRFKKSAVFQSTKYTKKNCSKISPKGHQNEATKESASHQSRNERLENNASHRLSPILRLTPQSPPLPQPHPQQRSPQSQSQSEPLEKKISISRSFGRSISSASASTSSLVSASPQPQSEANQASDVTFGDLRDRASEASSTIKLMMAI